MRINYLLLGGLIGVISNLQAQQTESNESDPKVLKSIEIQAVKPLDVGKLSISSINSPTTTNSVSSEVIQQRNVTDLGEAVKSATGVRPINRYGGFQTFRIRGFNNFVLLIDGVRDERHNISTSAPTTNLANVERIEVLKGPASVLYGHSALGGIINIVRKKPTSTFSTDFKATYGSFNTFNFFGGVGGPISEKLRYRADLGTTRTDGWRDYGVVTNNASFMFDYTPTKKDKFEFYIQLNDDKYDTDTGIPVDENGNVVSGMDPHTRYNDPQDYLKHKRTDLQLKYTHQFNSKSSLTNLISWSYDNINYLSTEWLYFNEAQDSITRGFPFYFNHVTKPLQNQLDFTYKFKTGKITHKSIIGHSFSYLDRKTFRGEVIGEGTFTTIAVNDPILNQGHIEAIDNRVQVKEEIVNGFYFQDWINLSDKLKALVGIRYDLFSGTYYTDTIDNNRNLVEKGKKTIIPSGALTYRTGVVYQPIEKMSIFGSYSNYFKPSRRIAPDGEIFNPETGYQIEGGIKLIQEKKLNLTFSGFYLLKNNIVEKTTVNDFQQIGTAESKGIELDIVYEPFKGMYAKAGYAYTNARVKAYDVDTLQVIEAGNKLAYAPEHMANLWLNYVIQKSKVKGLGFGVGMNYVSENFTSATNKYALPSYYTMDGTIYYQKDKVRIGVNVNNITNQSYYTDAIYGNQFFPGQGRNFKISIGYHL